MTESMHLHSATSSPATGPLVEITRGREKFTQRVGIGDEGCRPSAPRTGRLRFGTRRDRQKPCRGGSLRPGGSDAGALHFEADISGSDSNRLGYPRGPRPSVSAGRGDRRTWSLRCRYPLGNHGLANVAVWRSHTLCARVVMKGVPIGEGFDDQCGCGRQSGARAASRSPLPEAHPPVREVQLSLCSTGGSKDHGSGPN